MKDDSFDIPPRGEFEDDATAEQLEHLERLVEIDSAEPPKVGKLQASWLIDRIEAEQKRFKLRAWILGGGIGLIIGIILQWFF